MSLFREKVSRDTKQIHKGKLDLEFMWPDKDSTPISCSYNYGQGSIDMLDIGGSIEEASITIVALLTDFPSGRPEVNDSVWIDEGEGAIEFQVTKKPFIQGGTDLVVISVSDPDINNEY